MSKTKSLILGWGINDVDYSVNKGERVNNKWKRVWTCPYYQKWVSMIERCFSLIRKEKNITYRDCTICEDWKYLSNFIKWVDSQPNRDWQNCELDKDLLVVGNKHYGPDTVVFVTISINNFIIGCGRSRGRCMIGVSISGNKKNRYKAECRNPFTRKGEYLGVFSTELEAHLAWKAKKHEHALKLADMQNDERVANRLRDMYAPDKDWTKE